MISLAKTIVDGVIQIGGGNPNELGNMVRDNRENNVDTKKCLDIVSQLIKDQRQGIESYRPLLDIDERIASWEQLQFMAKLNWTRIGFVAGSALGIPFGVRAYMAGTGDSSTRLTHALATVAKAGYLGALAGNYYEGRMQVGLEDGLTVINRQMRIDREARAVADEEVDRAG